MSEYSLQVMQNTRSLFSSSSAAGSCTVLRQSGKELWCYVCLWETGVTSPMQTRCPLSHWNMKHLLNLELPQFAQTNNLEQSCKSTTAIVAQWGTESIKITDKVSPYLRILHFRFSNLTKVSWKISLIFSSSFSSRLASNICAAMLKDVVCQTIGKGITVKSKNVLFILLSYVL